MLTPILNEKDLPMEELKKIGLADGYNLKLDRKDIQALLSGYRTSLISLKNFSYYGMEIAALNVKLSLARDAMGEQNLVYHPVYKQSLIPSYVSESEANDLITGLKANLVKEVRRDDMDKLLMVEYDHDTKEFVMTDTLKIKSPWEVNGLSLSPYQKERYKQGREIELEDGTRIQASSTSAEGIRSNRLALVVSLLMDGGISYMILQGIKALTSAKGKEFQLAEKAPGFDEAKKLYDKQESAMADGIPIREVSSLPGRGYTRSGISR